MSDDALIEAMHDDLYRLLTRLGVDDLTALQEAGALVEDLQRRFGGRHHYLPAVDKATRNARIAAELAAGHDPQQVAARHGVSKKTLARVARRTRRDDDGGGFGSPEWNL